MKPFKCAAFLTIYKCNSNKAVTKMQKTMEYDIFKTTVLQAGGELADNYGWRLGQSVFNLLDLDMYWKVARDVKDFDNVDCFYDDSKTEEFIKCAYKRLKGLLSNVQ